MSDKAVVPKTNGIRWDPFARLAELEAEFDRLWGDRWSLFRPLQRLTTDSGVWAPRTDVYEKDGALVVEAELPGVKKEEMTVEVVDGDLVIRGERKAEKEVKEENYYRMERSSGSFYRRLPLPEGVTAEQIEATMTDGVLRVRVPKPAESKPEPTKIPIK